MSPMMIVTQLGRLKIRLPEMRPLMMQRYVKSKNLRRKVFIEFKLP